MKRLLSLAVSFAVGMLGAITAASPAAASPAAGMDWTVIRGAQPDGASVLIHENEIGFAVFSVTLGPGRAGWGKASKKKWVFSSTFIELEGADNLQGSGVSYWLGTSSVDPDCKDWEFFTSKYTVNTKSCVDTVSKVTYVTLEFEAGTDTVLGATIDSAIIKANKTVIPVGPNRSHSATFHREVSNQETLTVDTATEDFVEAHIQACVDESTVDRGASAVISLAATVDGQSLPEVDSSPNPWVEWGESYWDDSNGVDGGSFLVDSEDEAFENVVGNFSGTIELPSSGIVELAATADLKIGGTSILEACPSEGEGFAAPLDVSEVDETVNATATVRSLPDDMVWAAYTGAQKFVEDGFGGIFTYNDEDDSGSASVTHFDAMGANNAFGGSGSHTLSLQYFSDLFVSRWGSGGSSLLSVAVPDGVTWEVSTRSMSSNERDDVTLTQRSLDAGCGVPGAMASSIQPVSAPVDLPLVWVHCGKKVAKNKYAYFTALASVDFTANDSLTFLANPTPQTGAVLTTEYLKFAVQPRGSGAADVLWIYTENINAKAKRNTVVNRAVTTVTGEGVATQTVLSGDPFPGANPDEIVLSAGASAGDWVGIAEWRGWDPVTDAYFVDRKVLTVSGNSTIALGRSVDFLLPDGTDFQTVKALRPKTNTEVLLGLSSTTNFDGETTTYYRAVVLQTESGGEVRLGELVSHTESAYRYTPGIPPIGQNSDGDMVVYWITSETEYQVVTWSIP